MKCPECGAECERGMRLSFLRWRVGAAHASYECETPGVDGTLVLPRSDDEPAEELTVYVEGVG